MQGTEASTVLDSVGFWVNAFFTVGAGYFLFVINSLKKSIRDNETRTEKEDEEIKKTIDKMDVDFRRMAGELYEENKKMMERQYTFQQDIGERVKGLEGDFKAQREMCIRNHGNGRK